MKLLRDAVLSALFFSPALAQMSLCDMYTTALLKENTATNQYTLVTLLVNTALIGNYTQPNMNAVQGILVPGKWDGQDVNLLPYFNGGLLSTNRGNKPTAVNFIDDGGALALAQNKPAFGTNSNQYRLLTHLYQYFGALLQCSNYGKDGFSTYQGNAKMYEAHKYMNLNANEMNYFIQQVGLSAASFGVTAENITYVANALNNTFNRRCSPKVTVLPNTPADYQAMCIDTNCVTAENPACASYNNAGGFGKDPVAASSTSGPQLSALAAQLSSIKAGNTMMMGGAMSFTTSQVVTSISGTAVTTSTVVPIGGGMTTTGTDIMTSGSSTISSVFTSTIPSSVVSMIESTVTSGSSTFTTTIATTEANGAAGGGMMMSSMTSVISSVITSGGSTYTSVITTAVAGATSTSKPNGAAMQTAAPVMMAAAVGAGLIAQML